MFQWQVLTELAQSIPDQSKHNGKHGNVIPAVIGLPSTNSKNRTNLKKRRTLARKDMPVTAVLPRVAYINTNVVGDASDVNKSNTPQGPAMIPSLLPACDIVTAPSWNYEQPSTLRRFNSNSKEAKDAMYWKKNKDGWKNPDRG